MWYVIQTITGKEQETIGSIERVLKGERMLKGRYYQSCFFIRRECAWRIGGRYRIHMEPLFPSYVFVETTTPEVFFLALKRVPMVTRLLESDGVFGSVREEEERLLRALIGGDKSHVIRRSLVTVDEEGNILSAEGALHGYLDRIVRKRLRKRSVTIEIPFLGEARRVEIGIRVAGDEEERAGERIVCGK